MNDSVRVLRRPVTVVPTHLLQDRSLTYQALAVYVVLLAFPDGVGDPAELVGKTSRKEADDTDAGAGQ